MVIARGSRHRRARTGAVLLLLLLAALALAASLAHPVHARLGVDLSSLADDASAWTCLVDEGFDFAIVRAYRSVGSVDSNAPATMAAAWEGGMSNVDVYMFPDLFASSSLDAQTQVDDMMTFLNDANAKFTNVWFDVEGAGTYWTSNCTYNIEFLEALIERTSDYWGVPSGIYASSSQWGSIMCDVSDNELFNATPLWYPHWDGDASFDDYAANTVGGFAAPTAKQYAGDVDDACGLAVDYDYIED